MQLVSAWKKGVKRMPSANKESTKAILEKLRQKTSLSPEELQSLQSSVNHQEAAMAGSHHFAISHHGIVADQELPGVLERK
jgi:hypothetical protein